MKKSTDSKSLRKSILIISVIVIVLLAVILIFVLGNKEDKNKNNNTSVVDDIGENVKLDEKGDKVNISDKLNAEKSFESYKVGNILLKTENGQTSFTADITNTSSSSQPATLIYITFVDENGTDLSKMGVYIRAMNPGEKISTKATTSRDLTNAYDFKVSK